MQRQSPPNKGQAAHRDAPLASCTYSVVAVRLCGEDGTPHAAMNGGKDERSCTSDIGCEIVAVVPTSAANGRSQDDNKKLLENAHYAETKTPDGKVHRYRRDFYGRWLPHACLSRELPLGTGYLTAHNHLDWRRQHPIEGREFTHAPYAIENPAQHAASVAPRRSTLAITHYPNPVATEDPAAELTDEETLLEKIRAEIPTFKKQSRKRLRFIQELKKEPPSEEYEEYEKTRITRLEILFELIEEFEHYIMSMPNTAPLFVELAKQRIECINQFDYIRLDLATLEAYFYSELDKFSETLLKVHATFPRLIYQPHRSSSLQELHCAPTTYSESPDSPSSDGIGKMVQISEKMHKPAHHTEDSVYSVPTYLTSAPQAQRIQKLTESEKQLEKLAYIEGQLKMHLYLAMQERMKLLVSPQSHREYSNKWIEIESQVMSLTAMELPDHPYLETLFLTLGKGLCKTNHYRIRVIEKQVSSENFSKITSSLLAIHGIAKNILDNHYDHMGRHHHNKELTDSLMRQLKELKKLQQRIHKFNAHFLIGDESTPASEDIKQRIKDDGPLIKEHIQENIKIALDLYNQYVGKAGQCHDTLSFDARPIINLIRLLISNAEYLAKQHDIHNRISIASLEHPSIFYDGAPLPKDFDDIKYDFSGLFVPECDHGLLKQLAENDIAPTKDDDSGKYYDLSAFTPLWHRITTEDSQPSSHGFAYYDETSCDYYSPNTINGMPADYSCQ